jgi:hypothetical protein
MADFVFFSNEKVSIAINIDAIRMVQINSDGTGKVVFAPDHTVEMNKVTFKEFIDVITRFKSQSSLFMEHIKKSEKEAITAR